MDQNEEKDIYEKMKELKVRDPEYGRLVYAIETEIKKFIAQKNEIKSYRPEHSKWCKLKVTVPAVPITGYQKEVLEEFLKTEYIGDLYGNDISVEKCWFKKKYKVSSYFYEEDE